MLASLWSSQHLDQNNSAGGDQTCNRCCVTILEWKVQYLEKQGNTSVFLTRKVKFGHLATKTPLRRRPLRPFSVVKPGVHVCPGCHMSPGEVTSVPRLDWARVSAINGPEMIWKVWAVIHAGAAACKHGGSWNAESEIELNIWHSSSSSAPWPGTHYQAPTQPGHGGIWPYYAWSLQLLHTAFQSPQ